ncbi:MAG: hypothetical protein GY811_00355 [Myxococcales bacterium]|nr:hypothetical protein [Myxococcales bacterium]
MSNASAGAADAAQSTVGIDCGEETCNEATQECCFTSGSVACVAQNSCTSTPSTCDGPEDCGGDICCGFLSGASCSLTCEGNVAELCHTPADCSTTGDMCCPIFGPLSACAPTCSGGGF